jgi:hypothetical protein
MTSASSLAFPGSRTLANWWRQLAPFEPQTLGVGYLFLHRLEAPASWLQQQALDPLLLLVLRAFALEQDGSDPAEVTCHGLNTRLHLDMAIVRRLVLALADLQLVAAASPLADVGSSWTLTEQGRETLRTGHIWSRPWKRGLFPFVERLDPTGRRQAGPHYLQILDAPSSAWIVEESAAFEVSRLRACVGESPEWKRTFGFPSELTAFPDFEPRPETAPVWDHVVVDRTERLLVVLFQGPRPAEELFGFGVRPEGWVLHAAEPVIRLPAGARVAFSELDRSLSLHDWQHAWQSWCQMRAVPAADAHECALSLVDERLHIAAPERLIRYLQAANNDIFKGETWILAGEGYIRQAARLDLQVRE